MHRYHVDTRKQQFIHRVEWILLSVVTILLFILMFIIDLWFDKDFFLVASLAPLLLDRQIKAPFAGNHKKYRQKPLFVAGNEKITGPDINIDYADLKAAQPMCKPARLGLLGLALGETYPDHLLIVLTLIDNTIAQLEVTLLAEADRIALLQFLQHKSLKNVKAAS